MTVLKGDTREQFEKDLAYGQRCEALAAPYLKEYAERLGGYCEHDGGTYGPDFVVRDEDWNRRDIEVKASPGLDTLCFQTTTKTGSKAWGEIDSHNLFYRGKHDDWYMVDTRKLRETSEWASYEAKPNSKDGELCKYFHPSKLVTLGCAENVTKQVEEARGRAQARLSSLVSLEHGQT